MPNIAPHCAKLWRLPAIRWMKLKILLNFQKNLENFINTMTVQAACLRGFQTL